MPAEPVSSHALLNFGVVLTPNKRLAAWLADFIARQCDDGEGAVLRLPRVLPYTAWVEKLSQQALLAGKLPARRLLTNNEELLLWQHVVEHGGSPVVPSTAALAVECQRAAARLANWMLSPGEYSFELGSSADGAAFLDWYARFLEALDRRGLATGWQVQQQLLALPEGDVLLLQRCIANPFVAGTGGGAAAVDSTAMALYGFNSLTPLQRALARRFGAHCDEQVPADGPTFTRDRRPFPVLDKDLPGQLQGFGQAGQRRGFYDSGDSLQYFCAPGQVDVQPCDGFETELLQAARWAADKKHRDPGARIAVVVPGIAGRRAQVQRVFAQAFANEAAAAGDVAGQAAGEPGAARGDRFELTAGEALGSLPLLRDFMLFAKAFHTPQPRDALATILQSPFIWPTQMDPSARAAVLAAIWQCGEESLQLQELGELLHWFLPRSGRLRDSVSRAAKVVLSCQRKLAGLRTAKGQGLPEPRSQFPSAWLEQFHALLQAFSWPGVASLSSSEFQQYSAFCELRNQAWRLDELAGEVDAARALRLWQRELDRTIFHAETLREEGLPPVQVSGVLEAEGMHFDALWVCGMSEADWPLPVANAALLPFGLQARYAMPGASAAHELAYATTRTSSLLNAAPELVLSYQLRQDDLPGRLSPLVESALVESAIARPNWLAPAGQAAGVQALLHNGLQRTHAAAVACFETLEDPCGLALPATEAPGEPVRLQAGVSMLADYALDPLYAYARHRLGINALDEPQPGLGYRLWGVAVHAALQQFWSGLHCRDALSALDASQLSAALGEAIRAGASAAMRLRFKPVSEGVLELQLEVIHRQLRAWLEREAARPPFEVIAIEEDVCIELDGLTVRGRPDRVDRLQDGGLLLMDYKTGSVSLSGWYDERVSSPQLPAYALALDDPPGRGVAGLAYACISGSTAALEGLADPHSAAALHDGMRNPAALRSGAGIEFQELFDHWRTALTRLAEEIRSGHAVQRHFHRKSLPQKLQPYRVFAQAARGEDSRSRQS